jgi:DNA-binding GntR family transcriptional regulator
VEFANSQNETATYLASGLKSPRLPSKGVGQHQLSQSVASHLREQIISGMLKKGEFLRIDAIAKGLGVSTTPVREGLLLLQSESFVRLIPRRGFVVNSFSKGDLIDLFWAQAMLAAELAARAATKMSKADVARLEKIQADHKAAFQAGDQDLVARIGHEFHRAINLAAQSPRLALLLGSLTKQLPNRFYASIEGQLKCAVEYHPIIIEAIRVKDAESVRSLMYRHIISSAEHLTSMLERQGIWGESFEGETADVPPASSKRKSEGETADVAPAPSKRKTVGTMADVAPASSKRKAARARR